MRLSESRIGLVTRAGDAFEREGYIACMCVALAFAVALAIWGTAPQLEPTPSLQAAMLASAAAVLGAIATIFELRSLAIRKQWFDSALPALLAGLVAGLLLLWAARQHAGIAYSIIGVLCIRLLTVVFSAGPRAACVPMLAGVVTGYWAFLLSFVDGYKTPWIDEAVRSGTTHVDLLFHSAIANMLSGYGAGSLGVDGLVTFPYHFGSHRIAILLCGLLDIDPLPFYSVVFPLIFGPLFICFLYFFATAVRGYLVRTGVVDDSRIAGGSGWYWGVFVIFFVGVISAPFRRELGVWDNVFHSESFGDAVLFAYLGGIWVFDQLGGTRRLRLTWWASLILAFYLAALCVLKISVGMVMGGVFGYVLLRNRMPRYQQGLGLLAVALPLLLGFWLTRSDSEGAAGPSLMSMVKPFAFVRDIIAPELYVYSFLAFFGPLITMVVLRLLAGWRGSPGLCSRIANRSLLDVELAIVITVISITPGLILSVPQGSTNFFAEMSYWWVQPMMAVVMSNALARFAGAKAQQNHPETSPEVV